MTLKDLKASYPVEIAEYAVANRLVEEPAFEWWVPYTLKKRGRIISKCPIPGVTIEKYKDNANCETIHYI